MVKKVEQTEITTVNPKLLTSFTINPAAHFSEVDSKRYHDGKLIRSSFENRLVDAYIYLGGIYYRDETTGEVVGGKAGVLDFIIPHYFVYRAWLKWTKVPARAIAGFFITIPLGLLSITLYVIKHIFTFAITLFSIPLIALVHAVYNDEYSKIKETIKNLIITKDDPTLEEEPQKIETVNSTTKTTNEVDSKKAKPEKKPSIFKGLFRKKTDVKERSTAPSHVNPKEVQVSSVLPEEKPLDLFPFNEAFVPIETYQQRRLSVLNPPRGRLQGDPDEEFSKQYPHFVESVSSFKMLFSYMKNKTELVEDKKHNMFIKVTKLTNVNRVQDKTDEKNYKTFFIKVDPENAKPLREALHLNIFGMTQSLESKRNEEGKSDLDRVEEVLTKQR